MTRNAERSATTRAALIGIARTLFSRDGFAATGTEAILEGAGVRRGALYHHFDGKAALFEAVCAALSEQALPVVEAAAARGRDPLDALVRGSIAWIAFVTHAETRQILLLDAPTVLGWQRWDELDRRLSRLALRNGIQDALDAGAMTFDGNADLLATMLNGALNALALRVGAPGSTLPVRQWQRAVRALFAALVRRPQPPPTAPRCAPPARTALRPGRARS